MKIVIDIVDDDYNRINSYPDGNTFYPITARLYKAVKDGIPLDKIRAEIEFEVDHRTNMLCAEDVFEIIDKYRKEQE